MKDFKNDSDTTLARFGRDKRARISSAERIEPVSYTHLTLPTICSV